MKEKKVIIHSPLTVSTLIAKHRCCPFRSKCPLRSKRNNSGDSPRTNSRCIIANINMDQKPILRCLHHQSAQTPNASNVGKEGEQCVRVAKSIRYQIFQNDKRTKNNNMIWKTYIRTIGEWPKLNE